MELSSAKAHEAKKLKTSVEELLFADLLSIGYTELDAYTIAFPENVALSAAYQKSHRTEITSKAKFKQLCEDRREKNASYLSVSENAADIELIDASEVAKEILLAAKKQKVGTKERADLMAKYNDIVRENVKDIGDGESEPVQFYLPVACEKCPLLIAYNSFLSEKNEDKPQEEWDLMLKPDEMQRIIEQADPKIRKMRK